MKAIATWKGNMKFTGESASGFPVQMDADDTVGGSNSGVRPMELMAISLAGCTAMDVISILTKKQQDVAEFEVHVDAPRSLEFPKVFTNAVITYTLVGKNIDKNAVLRAIELSAVKYCPAQAMLEKAFPIELKYEIYESGDDGNKVLKHQGVWKAGETK